MTDTYNTETKILLEEFDDIFNAYESLCNLSCTAIKPDNHEAMDDLMNASHYLGSYIQKDMNSFRRKLVNQKL